MPTKIYPVVASFMKIGAFEGLASVIGVNESLCFAAHIRNPDLGEIWRSRFALRPSDSRVKVVAVESRTFLAGFSQITLNSPPRENKHHCESEER